MKALKFDFNLPKIILRVIGLSPKNSLLLFREDWPEPKVQYPNQVQIKVKRCGICTSDLHQLHVKTSYFISIWATKEKKLSLGHELMGIVSEIGSDVKNFQVGDRVAYNPVPHCITYGFKPCASCQNGNWENCNCLTGIGDGSALEQQYGGRNAFGGVNTGGWGESLVGFEKQFYKIPPNVPDEVAVLLEPFAVAIHAVARNPPKDSDKVIVFGAGIIGLLTIAAIRSLGYKCKIYAVVRYNFQADAAKRLGADDIISDRDPKVMYDEIAQKTGTTLFQPTLSKRVICGNVGPDIIYDSVVTETTVDDGLRLIQSNGKIVLIGLGFIIPKHIDWTIQLYKEITVVGTMMHGMENLNGEKIDDFQLAMRFFAAKPELYQGLVTHSYPIDEYKTALNVAEKKGKNKAIKVTFKFE